MDQLPGHGRILRHRLEHGRRLLLASGRAAATAHQVPVQQRPGRRRRPVPLPQGRRRRRVLVAVLAADPDGARRLRVQARHVVHHDQLGQERDQGEHAVLRAARRDARGLAAHRRQRPRRARRAVRLLLGRVRPLGRAGRRHELPAELLHRRGRGRRRRDLPQDRVPRAPRPLRLLRLLRAAGRVRHPARGLPRPLPRVPRAARRRTGRALQLVRARLVAARRAPRQAHPRTRRGEGGHLRPRLLAEPARRQVRPGRPDQQGGRQAGDRPLAGPADRARRRRGPAGVLGRPARRADRGRPRRRRQPDGQHLERLPVHGDVQHEPLGLLLRDGDLPRHGVPRLVPGPPRVGPARPGARPAAHPRPGRHPVRLRRRVPPVPAAHQDRQRRDRRRVQRRPALARARRRRLPEGDRRRGHPRGAGRRSATRARRPSTGTWSGPSATRSTGSARTACRSSAAPTGTTA